MTTIRFLNKEIITLAREIYKIDLSGYKPSFIDRRLKLIAMRKGIFNARQFTDLIINSKNFNQYLEEEIPVHVTSLFRNQDFFRSLIEHIASNFNNAKSLKIWHPGCSDGSEVYSLAMLMNSRMSHIDSLFLGTDITHDSIFQARTGSINCKSLQHAQELYRASGGLGSISEYVISSTDSVFVKQKLYDKIKFSRHIIGSDATFNSFDIIVCRNMLMYYHDKAKESILTDIYNSLTPGGILAIGNKETLHTLNFSSKFEVLDKTNRIYQKI